MVMLGQNRASGLVGRKRSTRRVRVAATRSPKQKGVDHGKDQPERSGRPVVRAPWGFAPQELSPEEMETLRGGLLSVGPVINPVTHQPLFDVGELERQMESSFWTRRPPRSTPCRNAQSSEPSRASRGEGPPSSSRIAFPPCVAPAASWSWTEARWWTRGPTTSSCSEAGFTRIDGRGSV